MKSLGGEKGNAVSRPARALVTTTNCPLRKELVTPKEKMRLTNDHPNRPPLAALLCVPCTHGSTGLRPVSSSSRMTPNEYTSDLAVYMPDMAYSGAL